MKTGFASQSLTLKFNTELKFNIIQF